MPVVDGGEFTENVLRRGGTHEGDGAVPFEEVGAGRVPRPKTAVNGSVVVGGKVVVGSVDTVGKIAVRGLVIVGPVVGDAAPNVTATGRRGGAKVGTIVALRVVPLGRIFSVADAQPVDRDMFFTDNDLVGKPVGNA